MANSEATSLSLDKVNALLPDNLKIDIENRLERSVYKICQGKPLPVINSKLYPQNYYWYSCTTTYFKNIGADYTFKLVALIPDDKYYSYNDIEQFEEFCEGHGVCISDKEIEDPKNPANFISSKIITYYY